MTRSLGAGLPQHIVERLSQSDLTRRLDAAMPLVTVDGEGRPHPMIVSYLEVRAYDARTLGLVIQAASGSARNLAERRAATLVMVEPDLGVYIKLRVIDGPLAVADEAAVGLGYFLLEVEEVLEDAPADFEGAARITSGIRYAPSPTLEEPWAQATLTALASPRARV